MTTLRQVVRIVRKDLREELRTREAITSTVFFSLLVLLVFNFAFEPGARDLTVVGAGILWIAFLFSGILAMNRLMLTEREDGGLEGLMLCPVPRTTIYAAKCTSLAILLAASEAVTLVLFVVLFNARVGPALPELLVVAGLGTLGLVGLGTTFGTMAVRTRTREFMLPLLLVPVAVPLLIAAVECTSEILAGRGLADSGHWLRLIVVFDVLFLAVGYVTFPALLEE